MADAEPGSAPVRQQRFQRRMSDAEALMWNVEKDPWLNPSGGSFSILDRMPDVDHLRAQLAAAVVEVPRLMEHVVGGLGRYSPPVWRPDPEFDLDHHLRIERAARARHDAAAARHRRRARTRIPTTGPDRCG